MIGTVILLQFLATHGSLAPAPAAATMSAAAPAYSAAAIEREVQQHAPYLRQCYDQHRPAVRAHIGRIRLRFALASDGSVESAQIEHDGLHSRAATACMERNLRSWQFPAPPAPHAQLEYTFLFR